MAESKATKHLNIVKAELEKQADASKDVVYNNLKSYIIESVNALPPEDAHNFLYKDLDKRIIELEDEEGSFENSLTVGRILNMLSLIHI